MPEETIKISKVKQDTREYAAFVEQLRQKQGRQPICEKCIKVGWDHGKRSPQDYLNMKFKELNRAKVRDRKDRTKIIGEAINYECPSGHGITVITECQDSEKPAKTTTK